MEKPVVDVKFRKDFETLYTIAMTMADSCIVNKPLARRFEKLHEEYKELSVELVNYLKLDSKNKNLSEVKGELGDMLFVLLHISHIIGWTPFELLHQASSKMLARMNDENYIAKN